MVIRYELLLAQEMVALSSARAFARRKKRTIGACNEVREEQTLRASALPCTGFLETLENASPSEAQDLHSYH